MKRRDRSVVGQFAFRKNENAFAAFYQLAGIRKTLAKTGPARQRKNVEQRDNEKIFQPLEHAARKR